MARAEIESNKLQELLKEYEAGQKSVSQSADEAIPPGSPLSRSQSDLVGKMLVQLQTVSESAANSVRSA